MEAAQLYNKMLRFGPSCATGDKYHLCLYSFEILIYFLQISYPRLRNLGQLEYMLAPGTEGLIFLALSWFEPTNRLDSIVSWIIVNFLFADIRL